MNILKRIKLHIYNDREMTSDEKLLVSLRNWLSFRIKIKQIKIASIDETLDKLSASDCSMCRFGDGEFKVIFGGGNCFQKNDKQLALRLQEVLKSNSSVHLLICIPNFEEKERLYNDSSIWFWRRFIRLYGDRLSKIIKRNVYYYNADATRLYIEYKSKESCERWFSKIKTIWSKKKVLIVEGKDTKLGIGNDLLSSCIGMFRIICPSHSAFSYYYEILQRVKTLYYELKCDMVLIALGPTATVLAHDLHNNGIRALDIGHVDIEYMWYQMGTEKRVNIEGKHTAELDEKIGEIDPKQEQMYLSQIVDRIGIE